MAEAPNRRRLAIVVRIVVTVTVFWLVSRFVDLREVGRALSQAELQWLVPALLLRPLIYLVRSFRLWQALCIGTSRTLPFLSTAGWHFVSLNLSAFTPAGLGDFVMVHFMRRHRLAASQTVAAVLFDKSINFVVLITLAAIAAHRYLGVASLWSFVPLLALGVSIAVASRAQRHMTGARMRFRRASSLFDGLDVVLKLVSSHPAALAVNLAGAVVQSLLIGLYTWLCFLMVDGAPTLAQVFWLASAGRLANQIPFTLGGLGAYEGSMVWLMHSVGVPGATTLAATLIARALTWLLAATVLAVVPLRVWSPSRRDERDET